MHVDIVISNLFNLNKLFFHALSCAVNYHYLARLIKTILHDLARLCVLVFAVVLSGFTSQMSTLWTSHQRHLLCFSLVHHQLINIMDNSR